MQRCCKDAFPTTERLYFLCGPCKVVIKKTQLRSIVKEDGDGLKYRITICLEGTGKSHDKPQPELPVAGSHFQCGTSGLLSSIATPFMESFVWTVNIFSLLFYPYLFIPSSFLFFSL
jgi:hypothetical protein